MTGRRPNVLLLLSDQERHPAWMGDLPLPARDRLRAEGVAFDRYYTNGSPCSPARASLFTGLYVPQHGIRENVVFPSHPSLEKSIPTLGHRLRAAGYRSSYLGKWHLEVGPKPDMESYGFSDWDGNDQHFMGWSGTGREFDPMIADQACRWLREVAPGETRPWFLAVALVNPHDVMWFPIDQPDYQRAHREEVERLRALMRQAGWKDGDPIPPFPASYPERFDALPANFHDDLDEKPTVHRIWMREQQQSFWGRIEPDDHASWLRQLDYYYALHRIGDEHLARILATLDEVSAWEDTVVIFTSDHGDMCGSHGLRAKGPFVYDEIARVPLYVRAPGWTTAGARTQALASHVDLARTIVSIAGADGEGLPGMDLTDVFRDPARPGRESILFAQEQSWYSACIGLRYASRAMYDGRYKYARYFGCGGGFSQFGQPSEEPMQVGPDAPFEEHEHELYDHDSDPLELRNLARDPGYDKLTRELFERLKAEEAVAYCSEERTAAGCGLTATNRRSASFRQGAP